MPPFPQPWSRPLTTLGLALLPACTHLEHADYGAISGATGIELSRGPSPAHSQPMGLVFTEDSGFYLLGYIPIVGVSVEQSLHRMAEDAAVRGADGIATIEVDYTVPSFLRFEDLSFPWIPVLQITGEAWRHGAPSGGR